MKRGKDAPFSRAMSVRLSARILRLEHRWSDFIIELSTANFLLKYVRTLQFVLNRDNGNGVCIETNSHDILQTSWA